MAVRVNGGNGYKTCGSGTSPLLSLLLFSKMQKAEDTPEHPRRLLQCIQKRKDTGKSDGGGIVATGLELCEQSE